MRECINSTERRNKRNHSEQLEEAVTEIIVCVASRTLLSVIIVIVVQIWKVCKQQAQTTATLVLCSIFVSQLETLS